MRKDIHPKYYQKTIVQCACGNTFKVASTKEFIQTDICFKCHPFYTGKEKFVDKRGQIEKFKRRLQKAKKKYESR